jgi:LysR family hydrogen peroxide-inducible transcriptional activator
MSATPTLKQLEYFVQLGKSLKFTEAAQKCFVNQSTLSVGISDLEHSLGVRLFERNNKNVMLTPIGKSLLEKAQHILQSSKDLVDFAQSQKHPMQGKLTLGVIPTIAPFILPSIIGEIRDKYPAIDLVIKENTSASLVTQVSEGYMDMALLALPFDIKNLQIHPIIDEELMLVMSKNRSIPEDVPLKNLDTGKLILLQDGYCLREHTLVACQVNQKNTTSNIEASSLQTLIQLIEADFGFSLLPAMATDSTLMKTAQVSVHHLQTSITQPKRTLGLVYRPTHLKPNELTFLATFLQRKLQPFAIKQQQTDDVS